MAITMDIPSFKDVAECWQNTIDRVRIFDNTDEFLLEAENVRNSYGENYGRASVANIRRGDMDVVARAEELITRFEHLSFNTSAFRIMPAMSGGVPNVPALLSGNPLAMRTRQRAVSAMGPLNIVIETTASAGYGAGRGVALLALARMLSAVRPVKLFVTAMGIIHNNNGQSSQGVAMPLDTAPLDLSRAGAMIGNPEWTASAGVGLLQRLAGSNSGLSWAYNNSSVERGRYHEYWSRALGIDGQELLAVPAAFLSDPTDPETWMNTMLRKYGGIQSE